MSSTKKYCLRSESLKRRSFGKRICDDLCQLILTYLSPEDQLRLRCVSKQFQRTILTSNKQFPLKCELDERQCLKKFELILQKFPNIKEFNDNEFAVDVEETKDFHLNIINYNKLMKLLFKYCLNLKNIILKDVYRLNDRNMDYLREMVSSKLISVDFNWTEDFNQFFAPIEESNVEYLFVPTFCKELTEIRFKKLKTFEIIILPVEELDNFEVFAETNAKNIKHLIISSFTPINSNFYGMHPEIEPEEYFKRLLILIAKFKNLVDFQLSDDMTENQHFSANHLKPIALNCKQFKSLRYYFTVYLKNGQTIDNMLEPFKQFKQLKRLDLELTFAGTTDEESVVMCNSSSFKAFQGFNELTHLEIHFGVSYFVDISENIFTDIDTYLPNLQSLCIPNNKFTSYEAIINILSRLRKLQSLKIGFNDMSSADCDSFETRLRQKCKEINSIEYN